MKRYLALALLPLLAACQQQSPQALRQKGDEFEAAARHKRVARTFEEFIASPTYRTTRDFWRGGALAQYAPSRSRVEILLNEQRGRLYINNVIAMDFPVCSGREGGYETPRGRFRISEKKREHRSSLYGSFVNSSGDTVRRNVHSGSAAPSGSTFRGTLMPYWMRFNGAIGMHTGVVQRDGASHGCVRVPEEACSILFEKLAVGSEVIVK